MLSVFVAVYPDEKGFTPDYMGSLSEDFVVLHPSFNFKNELGQEVFKKIAKEDKLPEDNNPWRQVVLCDQWSLGKCDVVLYDLDVNPGLHFLAWAVSLKRPLIGVSSTLRSVPVYFSGFVNCVVKPEDIQKAVTSLFCQKDTENESKA
jgi:hypothetical protein